MTLPVIGVLRGGVEYLERPVAGVLNPPEARGMGFWSLNPYVGCEFGCAYALYRARYREALSRRMQRLRDEIGLRPSAFTDLAEPTGPQLAFWGPPTANGQRLTANG